MAQIRAVYALDIKYIEEYKKAVLQESKDIDSYLRVLRPFVEKHYSWNYTNGISETKAEQKSVTGIFDIRFIGAERTSEEVRKETKQEIIGFTQREETVAELDRFKDGVSRDMEKLLKPSIDKLDNLFEKENNAIGLAKGNVSIASAIRADFSVADVYITEVRDIYNAYYNSPIQIRNEIVEYNNVTCAMIGKLNEEVNKSDYAILKENILGIDFSIPIFDDNEAERIVTAVSELTWDTSYKLFTEVFTPNSKYMTVHQAKGLEWDTVIVGVTPTRNENITMSDLYAKPCIINENRMDEFVRIYYVACSRARMDIYIHLREPKLADILRKSIDTFMETSGEKIELCRES